MGMKPAKSCVDIGIIAKDIKKSLAFYVDLLGLKKVEEVPLWFGLMHRLSFGDSFVKVIDPKKVPAGGKVGLDQALGFRYLTFQISNIDEVCAACQKAGIPFEIPLKEIRPGARIAMVHDPDGNVVEFLQRD